jgi:endonuclease G, mitochondrial
MRRSISPMQSLLNDHAVMDEIRERIKSPHARGLPREGRIRDDESEARRAIVASFEKLESASRPDDAASEAIILAFGRPSLLIENGEISFDAGDSDEWKQRLAVWAKNSELKGKISSVGRVELVHHPDYEWVGTAWMVDHDVMVTNRHVAEVFAQRHGGDYAFIVNPFGETVEARVDFHEEVGTPKPFEVQIERVLFIADELPGHPDMALLKLAANGNVTLPSPLILSPNAPTKGLRVAAIGYPARDSRNSGVDMARIFHDVFDVKRFAPGEVTFVENAGVLEHDCTTLGGNSGSPVVNLEDGSVVALHFAGRFREANFGVKAATLKATIDGVRTRVFAIGGVGAEIERRTVADYEGREGFNEKFLGKRADLSVPMPRLSADQEDDAVEISSVGSTRGQGRYVLDYTHFSVVMSKSRRLAFFTAVNIDGTEEMLLKRKNTTWKIDPRIDSRFQAGNELYASNRFDRGHLVRRLDPVWGDEESAILADDDTFHFTNSAPQHELLNQKTWLSLEEYLLQNAHNRDLKVSVFSGPVFNDADLTYRDVQIPEEFWKVVVMVNPQGRLHATAYLLSQKQHLDDIEFVFGRFRTYQKPLKEIEKLTCLDFGKLRDFDPLGQIEAVAGVSPHVLLTGLERLVL